MAPVPWSDIKLLIIDLDNTLCDTFGTLSKPQWESVERALAKKGWESFVRELRNDFGKHGFRYALKRSGMSAAQMRYAVKIYDDVDVRKLRLFPDAKAVLGLPHGKVLLSRGERALQRKKIRHLGIGEYFAQVVIVDTFEDKTKAIKDILRRHRVKPREALIVGDRIEEEITDGMRLGIPTALVLRQGKRAPRSKVKPDVAVRSLGDLARKLRA
jgi:FMN phosphatase YigB (HAD superfamily)